MTGYGVKDIVDLEGIGEDIAVLHKPWTLDELAQAVRQALDRESPAAR